MTAKEAIVEETTEEAQPWSAIGRFSELAGREGEYNIYLFNISYKKRGNVYMLDSQLVKVAVPKVHSIDTSKIYEVSAEGPAPDLNVPYYADTLEAYDEITMDGTRGDIGFYNFCMDYNCTTAPPYQKITPPIKRLYLSFVRSGATGYTKGFSAKRAMSPKGNISFVVVFLYDYATLPDDKISILKGMTNTSKDQSFMHVSTWYKEQAEKLFGNGDIINISVTFLDAQIRIPENLQFQYNSGCDNKLGNALNIYDYIKSQLPEVENYDHIIQYYYATNDSVCRPFPGGFDYKTGHRFINLPQMATFFDPIRATLVFAHELAHMFGAYDKYYEGGPLDIDCLIEPDSSFMTADLMCGIPSALKIETEKHGETVVIVTRQVHLSDLIIGEATAKEIGWYDIDGDGILEVEDPCPLNKDNDCVTYQ